MGVRYISSRSELRLLWGNVEHHRPVGLAETIMLTAHIPARASRRSVMSGASCRVGSRWAVPHVSRAPMVRLGHRAASEFRSAAFIVW